MHITKTVSAASLALGLLASPASQAQEAPPATQFSVGVKIWSASWMSYLPATYVGVGANNQPLVADVVNSVEGSRRTSALPLLAVRYGNYLASASYGRFSSDFSILNSPVATAGGTVVSSRSDHFVRNESDLTLGYFVLPGVALTAGYKYATESRDTRLGTATQAAPLLESRVRSLLVGVVGSFPVHDALSAYVQAGYGPARVHTRTADNSIAIDVNGRYLIGEIGLSYPFLIDKAGLRAATAAIGYRTQTMKTDSIGLIYRESRRLRDVRDGLVLSLTATL
jgi:hypothetical protein